MSVVDDVKQKLDIVEVIGQYATVVKSGKNFRANCPFHNEKNPSFYIYPEQQSWHCFGACNTGGDVLSFVMRQENMDFGDTLRMLAQRVGITIPSRYEPEAGKDERDKLYSINEAAALYFHNLLVNSKEAEKARSYLEGRSLSPETISNFQLGYCLNNWQALKEYLVEKSFTEEEILEAGLIIASDDGKTHDRFRNRLVFPIKDNRGRTTGFGARVLDDSLPKYVNSPQTPVFDKSGTLYAINLAAPEIRKQDRVVIVEGYMDVITAHQSGFTNVIASMGTAITEKQVTILKRMTKNLVLALDSDTAGEEAMLRCVDYENILESEIKVAVLPEGKDPDDVIREKPDSWQNFLDESIPVLDFTFGVDAAGLDLSKAGDQSKIVNKLGSIITKMKDPVRKSFYIQKLAQLTDKEVRTIEAALNQVSAGTRTRQPARKETAPVAKPVVSNRIEEDCLALLLQHPELKSVDTGQNSLLPEYFGNSENRELFLSWQQIADPASLPDNLDDTLVEHYETLLKKPVLDTKIEERYNDYRDRLHKDYLQGLARKRASLSGEERVSNGLPGEEVLEESRKILEIMTRKSQKGREKRS
ncbi:DNA primase [Chloroflexota bacterium]